MPGTKRFSRIVSLLLMLALVWAPVLPSLAMTTKTDDVHAAHAGNHGKAASAATSKQAPCTQHDSCNGQCCDICAQCFSAVSPVSLEQVHPHPVQIPVLTKLHPRISVASPDRPPRILSL